MEEKTKMTIENMQALWQTIADIAGRKYGIKIQAVVERKK